jgi:hypothetical protein
MGTNQVKLGLQLDCKKTFFLYRAHVFLSREEAKKKSVISIRDQESGFADPFWPAAAHEKTRCSPSSHAQGR